MPKPKATSAGYDAHKEQTARRQSEQSAAGRDIGKIPDVADPGRRNRGLDDPEFFHLTYFPNSYYLGFGDPHRRAIRTLADCTEAGGLHAMAMPRGFGKTTLTEREAIRAIVYGLRRYVVYLGATDGMASRALKRILREFELNDLLLEDFPEVCFPIRALERISQRCKGQTCGGEPTLMEVTDGHIVLPTIRGSVSSGAVIQSFGLTGALKGLNVLTADGTPIRPDLVILDDCQTRESAKSPTQTEDRERIICDDVLGLAGPRTKIAAVFLCTPIYVNDLTERFIDRDRHPEWKGARTRMVEQFPADRDWWERYAEVRREGLRNGDEGRAANELYAREQAAADAGCVLAWPDRVKDGDVSAVQTAMNLQVDNPVGFGSEYQCEPQQAEQQIGSKAFDPAAVQARMNGLERGIVPAACTRLTAFIDVGDQLLWWMVCGWNEHFGGAVIDYGAWPRQRSSVFSKRDPRPALSDDYKGLTPPQRVYAGLSDLIPAVLARDWPRQHGGEALRIERALVDTGDGDTSAEVRQAVTRFASLPLIGSKGVGRSRTQVGVGRWKLRPGERSGQHWKITLGEASNKGRLVMFDPDHWKTFAHSAFAVPVGGPTGVTLFGERAGTHELLAAHLAAEQSQPEAQNGDRWDKWSLLPHRPDNDWFDCLVGCAVAASVAGVQVNATGTIVVEPPRKPVSLRELQEKRRREKEQKLVGRS